MALQLGCTVAELKHRLTVRELTGWYAMYELDPWGERRADVREAGIGAAVCSAWGAKVKPTDLIPNWDHDPHQEHKLANARLRAFIEAHNARQRHKGERGG